MPLAFSGYPANCPLPGAVEATGPAFRITEHSPPTDADFLSHHEMGEEPKYKPTATRLCKMRSLSIYRTIEDARQHLKMFQLGGPFIAAGHLSPDKGMTLLTPPPDGNRQSHTEWWCADGADRRTGFVVIEGRDDVAN